MAWLNFDALFSSSDLSSRGALLALATSIPKNLSTPSIPSTNNPTAKPKRLMYDAVQRTL
jgi:hypothetical protein